MRKLAVLLVVSTLFLGCDIKKYYSVSIINDSSKTVSYIYDENSNTLEKSDMKTYSVKAYTQPPKNIVDQNGIASIKLLTDSITGDYTFINNDYYNLTVKNEFPFEVTFSSSDFIDNEGSKYLTVDTGITNTDAKIYTKKPQFISTLSYPVIFDWSISDKTMSVVIR